MDYDNVCKLLCKQFPKQYAAWRIKDITGPVTVLKQELNIEPVRADSVIFLQASDRILHYEFQVSVENSNPPLPLRVLDYWVRLYRDYRLPIVQVVVLLKESPSAKALKPYFQFGETYHPFQIVRLWEEEPDNFLHDKALLPLAVLSQPQNKKDLLNWVAEHVKKIDNIDERNLISSCTQILAGLRFQKEVIHQVFKEGMMRESVIYQEILQEGLQEGRLEGQIAVISRLLHRRFGINDPALDQQLQNVPVSRLEELTDEIFEFKDSDDFKAWLQRNRV